MSRCPRLSVRKLLAGCAGLDAALRGVAHPRGTCFAALHRRSGRYACLLRGRSVKLRFRAPSGDRRRHPLAGPADFPNRA